MAADDDLPWTTSRCNRLLRPLSSKLAKLRKELERPQSPNDEKRHFSSVFATKGSPKKTANFTRPTCKPRGFEKACDPDWRPGVKTGAGKKTYGGRGAKRLGVQRNISDNGHISRPGEIAFTPLVTRIGSQLHSSPQVQQSPLKKYGRHRGPLLVDMDRMMGQGDLQKLVQGLLEAYANILQATVMGDEKKWSGSRSLMSACLRKLPAYIELEEHFAMLDREVNEEDEEKDVAAEIYEHLESQFEQRAGQGWKPFKYVVRAHATRLLCDAISDGTLGLDSVSVLATHCLNVSAWAEAEELLLSYLPLLEPLTMPINLRADLFDPQRTAYLAAIKAFVDRTGRYRLLYDILEHLIAYELMPLEWLATECMRPIWDRLARSISHGDHRTIAHTVQFLETVTLAGMAIPDERLLANGITGGARRFVPSSRAELRLALNTTFSSLLTVLSSIALVNNGRADETGQNVTQRITWMLNSIFLSISGRKDIQAEIHLLEADNDDVQLFAQRAVWAVFASLIVQLDGCETEKTMISLSTPDIIYCINNLVKQYSLTGSNTTSILGSLPELVSSTARGTGRIWKDDGFEQLQRLVQALMSLSGCRLPHKLWTTKRLALESAVEFAHSAGSNQHLAYARDIEKLLHSQGRLVIMPSPLKHDTPSSVGGFRWEEGIGEWVACTPFPKQDVKRQLPKPVPAIQLLPTPVQSEDEAEGNLPDSNYDDSSMWETTDFIDREEDNEVPLSSPIRQRKCSPISRERKRKRAASPMVIVVPKRCRLTPPESPVTFYPDLPEEEEASPDDGPRRSRRSRNEIKALTSRLRTQRSRTSTDSGLRNVVRLTYTEQPPADDEFSEDDTSEADSDGEVAASSDSDTQSSPPPQFTRAARRTRSSMNLQLDSTSDEADVGDDLGITPARPKAQRQVTRKAVGQKSRSREWWKVKTRTVVDSEDGSEDELSFH